MQLSITEEGHAPILVRVPGADQSPVVTIGRSEENDIVLTQSFVSARHARLFAGSMIEDVGSRNGTFVGGKRIEGPTLLVGRSFSLGGHALVVEPKLSAEDGMAAAMASAVLSLSREVAGGSARPGKLVRDDELPLLGTLVADDFEKTEVPADSTATDLYIYEAFQFIRNAERIISKIAGGLTKEPSHHTALPDADKNFRQHMAELLVQRHDPATRADLHDYLNKVFEWLYAAVHCYQKAAIAVVDELKGELSRHSLLRTDLVPWHARLLGLERSALWDRAESRLEDWTQTHVIDRLEAQVSSAARSFRMSNDLDDLE
ncbi:FHA domain protein [Planctomycetes bacterium Poly30]|uniref:FHA domain protein n=1 Tax=Saltatorellus ferox TaxID=2528018 RepID=A0A518EKH6_9BACT|nr:FHA domain protein [Planctomycetes bacterium Poly30]